VRLLRALRLATLILLNNPEYRQSVFQRIMRVDAATADNLFKLYRNEYNPDLTLPDAIVNDLLAVGTFRLKEKPKTAISLQAVRDWSFAGDISAPYNSHIIIIYWICFPPTHYDRVIVGQMSTRC